MIGEQKLTRKGKLVVAFREGYTEGFNIGRTRRDWKSLTLGLVLGFLIGIAAGFACWAFACL